MDLSFVFLVALFGLISTTSPPQRCRELHMENCNVCHCGMCTLMGCPPGIQYDDCVYNGNTYKHGDKFMNDCNNCVCNDGRPICFHDDCSSLSKRTPFPRLANKCWYNGKFYDVGTKVVENNDCNACHCVGTGHNTGIACTVMRCRAPLLDVIKTL
ncbi:hypothetical protein LOTGIDRAFT_228661 [Lottia gigantea]|uniref:VWFC domain-containing protein n=1 Tax=Lottia gigantea TaxID=225164 RepID=V4BY01_LOTGI|nr:hypothetical protein LOTGIDRAFT_228661 [Lottia gigantea]ESO93979.1 hypothetical protein LOTGIDRAFT_228661 [Lottia gigantea]